MTVPGPRASAPHTTPSRRLSMVAGRSVTTLIVVGPPLGLALALPFLWGHVLDLHDLVLATVFYVVTGFGVTVGYHRLLTHRSFRASRWLKVALTAAGSMAVEGSPVSWVANHRRHHLFSDEAGDPHSPHTSGSGIGGQVRGLVHAHVGWLFSGDVTCAARHAPDLLRDRDERVLTRLFPVFVVCSFGLPFLLGWTWSGTISGAVSALLWAGIARMALLHHVTWSVNSVCHMFGHQPATRADHSTNVAPLAVISFGESWHNFHHAHPASARHGALPHQIDPSAALIRAFERLGWATHVRWPSEAQLAACR